MIDLKLSALAANHCGGRARLSGVSAPELCPQQCTRWPVSSLFPCTAAVLIWFGRCLFVSSAGPSILCRHNMRLLHIELQSTGASALLRKGWDERSCARSDYRQPGMPTGTGPVAVRPIGSPRRPVAQQRCVPRALSPLGCAGPPNKAEPTTLRDAVTNGLGPGQAHAKFAESWTAE